MVRSEKEFRSITKLIVEELRAGIVAGSLAPGEELDEETLAASLKVGRVALREALRRLDSEGYVTALSPDRFMVSKPPLEEIEDHYAIAGALEALAAGLAVARGSAEEISRLTELHHLLKMTYRQKDQRGYFEANRQFHRFIAQMARNERLYGLIGEMRQEIRKTRILALHLPQRLDYSMREHDQILDAFLKRNPALAESIVRKHLANQMAAIKQSLRSSEA